MIATLTTGRQVISAETNCSGASLYCTGPQQAELVNFENKGTRTIAAFNTLVTKVADFVCCFV
jgi:hypothetical protein